MAQEAECREENAVQLCIVLYGHQESQPLSSIYSISSTAFFYPLDIEIEKLFDGPQLVDWAKDLLAVDDGNTIQVEEIITPGLGEEGRGYELTVTSLGEFSFTAHVIVFRIPQLMSALLTVSGSDQQSADEAVELATLLLAQLEQEANSPTGPTELGS